MESEPLKMDYCILEESGACFFLHGARNNGKQCVCTHKDRKRPPIVRRPFPGLMVMIPMPQEKQGEALRYALPAFRSILVHGV